MRVAQTKKPIILSTGMCTLGDVEAALDILYQAGATDISLLHCVTEYPAPYGDINLNAMSTMRTAFQIPVGYSDHTDAITISLAAVAMGATIIEKQLTLDKTMLGPDHKSSAEPLEFATMVTEIRTIERALGSGFKKPGNCELPNMSIVRKSLVSSKAIKKGTVLTWDNIACKRPGTGISPKHFSHF